MVEIFIDPGSGGQNNPAARAASEICKVVTPGSTSMVRFARSNSRILSILTVQRTMQLDDGTLPPLKPVPEPRVTTGVLVSFASFRISATSAVVRANTTQPAIT